jgi:FkbM family methyltransferase
MNTIAKMFQQAIKFTKFAFEKRNRPIEKMLFIIIFLHKIFMKKPYIIFKFLDGTTFLLFNVGDFISVSLSNEPETFKFIMKQIKNSKVFIDVGANIGGYAVRTAKYCKVYAFEPLPRNYKILKINEKLNNVKINSYNLAIGNKNGKVKLYYTPRKWDEPSIKQEQNYFVEVEMKPSDEIINEENIDLMKIDVERAEDLVLEGARNCLRRTKMLKIEYHKHSIFNVYKILKEEGFSYKKILDNNILFTKSV